MKGMQFINSNKHLIIKNLLNLRNKLLCFVVVTD